MKKTITNAKDALCYNCGELAAVTIQHNEPACSACGKVGYLRDPRGKVFEPTYGPAKFFRASKYTPPVPDRRINNRLWPKAQERRQAFV